MGRFTDLLKTMRPRNGRVVAEDGEAWNLADRGRFSERYDPLYQTIKNGAVRMSAVDRELQQGLHYYGLRVPAGRRLIVYSRTLKLTEGVFTIDVVVPDSGFTGGTVAVKSQLTPGGVSTVQSDLYSGVTPSGDLSVKDRDFGATGTNVGAGRAGGAPSVDNVVAVITGESCLRIDSEGADPYSAAIRLIAWEEDDPDA